jgi:hypothetical protein
VVSNSSLQIRNSELNPFDSYKIFSFNHNRRGPVILRVCRRGPSDKANLIYIIYSLFSSALAFYMGCLLLGTMIVCFYIVCGCYNVIIAFFN